MFYLIGLLSAVAIEGAGVWIALGCFVIVSVLWIVPDRRIGRAVPEYEKSG